ncbi:MAG: hypothetical protein Q9219_005047 [cf. Caloplaca sp. 3 TL-2023]
MDIINIDENGDLIVEVIEKLPSKPPRFAQFKVRRDILVQMSQVFLGMLVGTKWKESLQNKVSLGEGSINVTELWLRVIHKTKLSYSLPFPDIWVLVEAVDYYDIDITLFNQWFAQWYELNGVWSGIPAERLYPTWRFDHASGFAAWTRFLAYNGTGHIEEKKPIPKTTYHLPSRLMQQLNAAKGRLRTVLFRGLWMPCHRLLQAECKCKEKTLFDYQKHLYDIEVWPLETTFLRYSIQSILGNLGQFSYEAPSSACNICKQDFKFLVESVVKMVQNYFQGLCLDCLDRSKPKTGDVDVDYWRHATLKEHEWIHGCRFTHKQPTWYFSFNGRKEERDRLIKEHVPNGRLNYLKQEGKLKKAKKVEHDSDSTEHDSDEDRG